MSDEITITSTTDSAEEIQATLTGKTVAEIKAAAAAAAPPPAAPETPPAKPETPPAAADKPADATPPAKPAEAKTDEPAEEPPPANETPEQKAERERLTAAQKRHKQLQEQINESVRKKHASRQEAEAEEARLADLRRKRTELEAEVAALEAKKPSATPAAGAPATADLEVKIQAAIAAKHAQAPPKPELGDVDAQGKPKYENYEQWTDAVAAWRADRASEAAEVRTELRVLDRIEKQQTADRERIDRESATREHGEHLARFATKSEEFRKTHADFDAVVEQARDVVQDLVREVGPHVMDTIERYTTRDADHGPALVYHLSTHTDELERIAKLPPAYQLIELAKLDARMEAAAPPPPARPPAAPVTQAPPPITPVSGSPTAPGVPPDDEDFQTYKARRNAEERRARGLPAA